MAKVHPSDVPETDRAASAPVAKADPVVDALKARIDELLDANNSIIERERDLKRKVKALEIQVDALLTYMVEHNIERLGLRHGT